MSSVLAFRDASTAEVCDLRHERLPSRAVRVLRATVPRELLPMRRVPTGVTVRQQAVRPSLVIYSVKKVHLSIGEVETAQLNPKKSGGGVGSILVGGGQT